VLGEWFSYTEVIVSKSPCTYLNELLHGIDPIDIFDVQFPQEKSRDPSPAHTKIEHAMLPFYWSSKISESFSAIPIEDKGFLERINP
jgi:hypothetical protein